MSSNKGLIQTLDTVSTLTNGPAGFPGLKCFWPLQITEKCKVVFGGLIELIKTGVFQWLGKSVGSTSQNIKKKSIFLDSYIDSIEITLLYFQCV